MLFEAILLPSLLIPVAAALVALALIGVPRQRQRRLAAALYAQPRGGGAALALAFASAFVAMNGWPRIPPVEATQRLFAFLLLALPLSYFVRRLGDRRRLIATFLISLPLYVYLLQSQIDFRWSAVESVLWVTGLAALNVLIAAGWANSIERQSIGMKPSRPDPLWAAAIRPILLGLTALCLGLSGSALLGQLMGALAAAVATVEAWHFLKKELVWRKADAMVWTVASCGLIANTFFYAELSAIAAALLICSLALLAFNRSNASAASRVLCLIPVLIAAGLVVAAELEQVDSESDYYEYGQSPVESPEPLPTMNKV